MGNVTGWGPSFRVVAAAARLSSVAAVSGWGPSPVVAAAAVLSPVVAAAGLVLSARVITLPLGPWRGGSPMDVVRLAAVGFGP